MKNENVSGLHGRDSCHSSMALRLGSPPAITYIFSSAPTSVVSASSSMFARVTS